MCILKVLLVSLGSGQADRYLIKYEDIQVIQTISSQLYQYCWIRTKSRSETASGFSST